MCNQYTLKAGPLAIMTAAKVVRNAAGNMEPGNVYPDYSAPIVRVEQGERVLTTARWGLPSPAFALEGKKADRGVTNVRNTSSAHWRRWLRPQFRCLVPFTSFCEPSRDEADQYKPIWFALKNTSADTPSFFAGIWVPQWTGIRKIQEGEVTADLFAILTTSPSEPVRSVHSKAMPVILTQSDELEMWMGAQWAFAKQLQRPLGDYKLKILQ